MVRPNLQVEHVPDPPNREKDDGAQTVANSSPHGGFDANSIPNSPTKIEFGGIPSARLRPMYLVRHLKEVGREDARIQKQIL